MMTVGGVASLPGRAPANAKVGAVGIGDLEHRPARGGRRGDLGSAALAGPSSATPPEAGVAAGGLSRAEVRRQAAGLGALGRALFFDARLSASGRQACASCHDPAGAFGPANADAVQQGGSDLRQPRLRAVPSIKYLQAVPAFSEHFFDSEDDADESVDNGPTGGLTWDGRVDRGQSQARIPLLSPFEMANAGPEAVARRVLEAGYGQDLRAIFGAPIVERPGRGLRCGPQGVRGVRAGLADVLPLQQQV